MLRAVSLGPNERLERSQWDFFWVPQDAEVRDEPEIAAVRCPRPLPHLNMVTRTRAQPDRLPALVPDIVSWLHRQQARWLVPDTFDTRPLEAALGDAGWSPVGHYEARAIRPASYARRAEGPYAIHRVQTLERLRHWVDVTNRAFGREVTFTDAELAEDLAACADPSGRVHRFVLYREGEPVCSGGFNWYPDLRFVFLWAGGTVPEARGAGAYTALVARRIHRAGELGAEWVGVYAKDDTSAPIVARQGFERVGRMSYWAPPGSTGPPG